MFDEKEACARGQRRQTRGDDMGDDHDVREACGRLGRGESRETRKTTHRRER